MLRVRVFGQLSVEADGRAVEPPGSRRAWSLMAWLALHPGLHSRADVAAVFWPDVLDRSALGSMRSALWALRGALGPELEGVVVATRDRVGLDPEAATWVDVHAFADHVAAGHLEDAVALCRGELLSGLQEEWAVRARDAHREELLDVLAALGERATSIGDHLAAVRWARRGVALDPFSETATRRLMRAAAAAGDVPAALAAHERLVVGLRDQLRVTPSAETRTLAESIRAGGAAAARAPLTPRGHDERPALVGRDDEVALLREAWEAALRARGGVAVVHGEAGIGKSRLVRALADLVVASGGILAEGAAGELPGPPLAPWTDIGTALSRALGELPDAPWVAGLAPLLPTFVAPPQVPPQTPDLRRHLLFEAVVALLEAAASRGPVLLVIEDLHAADASTVALVAHAARRLAALPVLAVITRRERPRRDDIATLEDALRRRGLLAADIAVGPLPDREIAALARSFGLLEDAAVRRVVDAAEGSPLLGAESARALAVGGDRIPAGLRAAARAALGHCSAPARELAVVLAVAGRDIEGEEAAQRAGVTLADALEQVLDCGLVETRGTRMRYRHALLREAVYGDLPGPDRAARHAAAAALILQDDALDRAGEAAHHLRAAGRGDEAARLLARAGDHALCVGALDEAADLLTEVADLRSDDPEALLALADVQAWRHRIDEVDSCHARAIRILQETGDHAGLARAYAHRATAYSTAICVPRRALDAAREGLAVLDAAAIDPPGLRAEVLAVRAWCAAAIAPVPEAEAALDELVGSVGADPVGALQAHSVQRSRSMLAFRRGELPTAITAGRRAAAAAQRGQRPELVYACTINTAAMLACLDDVEGALAELQFAADAIRAAHLLVFEPTILCGRAWVLGRAGRLDEARAAADAAHRAADRLDAGPLRATAAFERARVDALAGDHESAAERFALALAEPGQFSRPLARFLRAEALARADRPREAEIELREAVLEPVRPGDWPDTLVARLAAVQGLIARARGDEDLAGRHLQEARDGWRRRAGSVPEGERWSVALADLGQPFTGLVEPDRELARVLADLALAAT